MLNVLEGGYERVEVESDCTLKQLCERHSIDYKYCCVYVEIKMKKKPDDTEVSIEERLTINYFCCNCFLLGNQ